MKRWLKYIKPYWYYFALTPLFIMVEVIGEVIMPRQLATLINSANAGTLTNAESMRVMLKMIITALCMMAGGILLGDGQRLFGDVCGEDLGSWQLSGDGHRNAATPRADIPHLGLFPSRQLSDGHQHQLFGLWPRDEHSRSHLE